MTLVHQLTDFPDRLSPMVVKELRQGLRTKLFGGVLLVLHALLVLITLMGGASADGSETTKALMDSLVVLVMCFIFPLCGFSALAGEMKANTIDMLVLTRLSAGRIVFGKWAAIVVQSLLVAVSVLPYMVARYMYGGSDLLADFITLANLWLSSAVLTAGVVALSTQRKFFVRVMMIAVPLLMVMLTSFSWTMVRAFSSAFPGAPTVETRLLAILAWVGFATWLIFAFLSAGASRIAPPASQLPAVKRLVNFVALLVCAAVEQLLFKTVAVSWLVMLVASVDALTDDQSYVSSVYLPFYRRSWWGRLAALVLAPGWMHGFLYSMLLAVTVMGIQFALKDYLNVAKFWVEACGIWAAVFFGHLLAIRRTGEYVSAAFAGACIMVFFSVMCTLIQASHEPREEWLSYLFPLNAMFLLVEKHGQGIAYFYTALMVNTIWPVLLSLLAFRAFRQTRGVRLEAERLLRA